LVEGTVITTSGITMYIDLGVYGTGIIYGREFLNAKDMIKNINVGDTVKGKIIETENENGYVELSLERSSPGIGLVRC
jgi:ribosomal protein S1